MAPDRISSLDTGYETGDLSLFPTIKDDKESLYEVRNNAETTLKQSLPFNGRNIIVKDASDFPPTGILRIGSSAGVAGAAELIYYAERTATVFKELVRGFAGSRQNSWTAGASVGNPVSAETHNAVKDALINIEAKAGKEILPADGSLNNTIKKLEAEHLSPKPLFRAFPTKGAPPHTVRFQNFSSSDVIRFLWDFGDGAQSIERSPSHEYQEEGIFTVSLNIITSTGSQGISTKTNYITVDENEKMPFFYVVQADSTKPAYSTATAAALVTSGQDPTAVPATFLFVDQTDGDILQRFWIFDDSTNDTTSDPNTHTNTHIYATAGEFDPSLLVVFSDESLKRVFLQDTLTVL